MGISQEEFGQALPDLVKMAFSDPSSLSNPRMPLLSELKDLFLAAYQGRTLAKTAEGGQ
jgi:acetaldehyde dehydrogenase/alcohol dehydrogenase